MRTTTQNSDSKTSTAGLRRISLVAEMLADPGFRLVPRALDKDWVYERALTSSVSGFNPYRAEMYYASRSAFADWAREPDGDLRTLNEGDFLVPEMLFAVHDYLHAWSVGVIDEIVPELGLGHGSIDRGNVEDLAWCHLFTEAVATVGLDYWYLACEDLGSLLDIGSTFRTLTVSYDERHRAEYRRFAPELDVQSPKFLVTLGEFYATGRFPGFDVRAVRRSPRVLKWLRHELSYGSLQRRYTRQWLDYMAGGGLYPESDDLERPLATDAPWQQRVLHEVAERLWDKVKEKRASPIPRPRPAAATWTIPAAGRLDFRFTNANAFGERLWDRIEERGIVAESFGALVDQVVSRSICAEVHRDVVAALPFVRKSRSTALLRQLLANSPRLADVGDEPANIFVLP